MNEAVAKPRWSKTFRRATLEWGGIGLLFAAVVCLVCWVAAVSGFLPDSDSFGFRGTVIKQESGAFVFSSHLDDANLLAYANWRSVILVPKPTGQGSFELPGLRWRAINFPDGDSAWRLDLSLLPLAIVSGIAGAACCWRLFALHRRERALVKAAA